MTLDPIDQADPSALCGQILHQITEGTGKLKLEPETVEADLAKLVLGLMEFLRQLMELQAIRRLENGSLTDEEEHRVGETLERAEAAIEDMAQKFGLSKSDLSLNLGPLGRTI